VTGVGPQPGGRTSALRRFTRFWWDFVVGDDWRVALGVLLGLLVVAIAARAGMHDTWWVLPVLVSGGLVLSVRRAGRRR
jgi:hypothetical protein